MLVGDCQWQEDKDERSEHAGGKKNILERLAAVRGPERPGHLKTVIELELVRSYAEGLLVVQTSIILYTLIKHTSRIIPKGN